MAMIYKVTKTVQGLCESDALYVARTQLEQEYKCRYGKIVVKSSDFIKHVPPKRWETQMKVGAFGTPLEARIQYDDTDAPYNEWQELWRFELELTC